jgi:hypothetical protein
MNSASTTRGARHLLAEFQRALRDMLEVFLNGRRRIRHSILRRSIAPSSAVRTLSALQQSIDGLISENPALHGRAGKIHEQIARVLIGEPVADRAVAEVLASCYQALDEMLESIRATAGERRLTPECPLIEAGDYSGDSYLSPVVKLNRFVERALHRAMAGFFLHGSLATLDYARGYSDFDTFVILRRSTVIDPVELMQLLPKYRQSLTFVYEFDPLQHHGHMLATEIDLDWYPEGEFPLQLLQHARCLGQKWQPLPYTLRAERQVVRDRIRRSAEWFGAQSSMRAYPPTAYELKSALSDIMLLPATYCQVKGHTCYKKYSFERARPDFDDDCWRIVEEATRIRKEWDVLGQQNTWRATVARRLRCPELLQAPGPESTKILGGRLGPTEQLELMHSGARLAQAMWSQTERCESG